MDPHVLVIDVPLETTPETLEPHPHSIPPMLEENAMVSCPGDLKQVKIKIGQENHADMDTSEAGPSFGGEWGSLMLKENAEIGPASEPMDPSEAESSSSEPRSRSKLEEPEGIAGPSFGGERGSLKLKEIAEIFPAPESMDSSEAEPSSSVPRSHSKLKDPKRLVRHPEIPTNLFLQTKTISWRDSNPRHGKLNYIDSRDVESFNRLDRPIMIPQLSPQDNNALHVAARYKQAEMAAAIIQRVPEGPELVNFPNMNGDLPLHIAPRTVLNLNITNKQGDTALHDAIRGAHLEVVKLLVQFNPSWTLPENKVGESPLFLAVDKWHFDIAISEADKFGLTPFHYAAHYACLDIFELLLEAGDSIAYKREELEGMSAVHIAARNGCVQIIRKLINKFPDAWELLNAKGMTALHVAAESGKQDVVDYLLEAQGFEGFINKKDKDGNTPLHLASIQGNHAILVKLADDKRVDGSAINNKGLTAVDIVQSKEVRQTKESEDKPVKEIDKAPKEEADSQSNGNGMYKDDMFVVVATLIASVTFGAALQIPGGYKDDDPGKGSAIMIKHLMFNIFVLADCFSFALSSGSIFGHFLASIEKSSTVAKKFRQDAKILTYLSIGRMVVAFTAGIHVALVPFPTLWAANTGLCIFFLWGPMLILAAMIYKKEKDKWHLARGKYLEA
ncbi:hypothetical protein ACB092_11G265400 [Castanea dentata]